MTRSGGDEPDDGEEYELYAPLPDEIATSPTSLGDIRRNLLRHVSAAASPAKAVAREEARVEEYLSQVQAEAELHRAEAAAPAASDLTKRIAESFDDRVQRARALLAQLARDREWQALKE
jgi:hypothetical protein